MAAEGTGAGLGMAAEAGKTAVAGITSALKGMGGFAIGAMIGAEIGKGIGAAVVASSTRQRLRPPRRSPTLATA
jgi:hypothetical protein